MAAASIPSISKAIPCFGDRLTIYTNRQNSSYTHTLAILLYTGTKIVDENIANNVEASIAWTLPMDLMQHIPNATSVRAAIRCYTFDGSGKQVGMTFSDNFTIEVPAKITPVISSFAAAQINGIVPPAWGLYIEGRSRARLTATASGQYGATIRDYRVNMSSPSGQASSLSGSTVTTGMLYEAGTYTFTVTVEDTRGQTASKTLTIQVTDYKPPAIQSTKAERCLADGTPDESGTYLRFVSTFAISPCEGKNSCTATVRYRLQNSSNWVTAGTCASGVTKVYKANLTDEPYVVQLVVKDALWKAVAANFLGIGTILFEYDPDANRLEFQVPVTLPNIPDYVTESGKWGPWSYRKWASGIGELWCTTWVQATSSTAIGSGFYSSQFSFTLPFAVKEAVVTGTAGNICIVTNADTSGETVVFRLFRPGAISTTSKYEVKLNIKGVLA